ncbi:MULTISPECIES: ATP-binding protein [Actinomadura]|uniref:ATP-binding protein n=1 Tax=Actinomadura yumaensis TaxID=111807 RepID=A0ABW2CIT1_9ACTN|nr:BTAD domain-containing putative transcriptional regulator [Actinomadura sp. J1-007]
MTTVRVLGAFAASVDGEPADLGGPRQRSVLARLVAAHGAMVPSERLVAELWADAPAPPPRAAAGLQSFVSHLRRALEPGRPPRTPARVLVTAPPGYALRLPEDGVDAWRFDALIDRAGERLGAGDAAGARRCAEDALAEWRGPAYAEFAALPWAAAEAARLDERRRIAVERRAAAMLALPAAAEAVPDLEAHAAANPLREEAWRLLALALYRAGRQGDALAALRRARAVLTEELGVDPGPALRRLEADILAQAPTLDASPAVRPADAAEDAPASERSAPPLDLDKPHAEAVRDEVRRGPHAGRGGTRMLRLAPESGGTAREGSFVGRSAEWGRLAEAARTASTGDGPVLALVSGDAGMGKTALIERFARGLAAAGWTCAWGRSPETGGAPAAWPWAELLRSLAAGAPPGADLAGRLAPLLDDAIGGPGDADVSTGRFRLHLAVGDYLERVAASSPLLLVLDDLHWTDEETLALLTRLADRLRGRPVLLACTFRQTEVPERLAAALAALARHEPVRVELGGLSAAEVAALVRATCDAAVDDAELAAIAERTGGNPFFTRETARLLDAEGLPAATRRVPAGVGDVLRRRIAGLPDAVQAVLRDAAVVGRDADLGVLTDLSGGDEDAVIDAVEAGLAAGLVTEPAPGRMRFAHALVRDTLYTGLSRARRTRLHGRAAAALERHRPGEVAAIAHHYLESGAEPAKAVRYARLAAEAAEARFAHRAAAGLWTRAADTLRDRDPEATRERLELEVSAIRACALAGEVVRSRERRRLAMADARAHGDVRLLARVIVAFDVPTLWTSREYGTVDPEVIECAEEALAALPPGDEELRVRLLTSLAIELEGEPHDRGAVLADEAVAVARRLGRPELLAVALNGRYLNGYRSAGDLALRRALATELLGLATAHDLGAYAVLAHLQLQVVCVAALDLEGARRHRERGQRLAERYGLPLLSLIAEWYRAVAHAFSSRYEDAERAYTEVGDAIARTGIWSSERGMAIFGVFCLRLLQGRLGELLDSTRWLREQWRHIEVTADIHALALIAAGRAAEARRVVAGAGPPRRDYFFDLAMTVRGHRAMALGERGLAEEVYQALLPYEDHVSGGATAVVTAGPVARVLGDLALYLGRPEETAAAHYRRAAEVAERLGAPAWLREARCALRPQGTPAA